MNKIKTLWRKFFYNEKLHYYQVEYAKLRSSMLMIGIIVKNKSTTDAHKLFQISEILEKNT